MRFTPNRDSARHFDPASMHSLGYVFVTSMLGAIGAVALVLAALYPVSALGVGALAVAGWLTIRTFRRYYRTRRRTGRTRQVCVPSTSVCVEL